MSFGEFSHTFTFELYVFIINVDYLNTPHIM